MGVYKNPEDALKTREEGGFRIALNDDSYRFPTEVSMKAAVARVNELARNHELKPCPTGQECRVCFITKAAAESDVLRDHVAEMYRELGPLAVLSIAPTSFFSMALFFVLLGQEMNKGVEGDAPSVDLLNKMFGFPASENNPASGDEKPTN
jgi:hypothetical protein